MNIAKDTKIITFHTTKQNKTALNNYTRTTGTTIKHVMNRLLGDFIAARVDKEVKR